MKRIGLVLATTVAAAGVGVAAAQQGAPKPPASQAKEAVKIDRSILHVQVILDHLGFSPGVLDGRPGMSLTAAIKGFQESRGMKLTGQMDRPTLAALHPYKAMRPTRELTLSEAALAGPFTAIPKEPEQQAKLQAMGYRAPIEKIAEMFHTTPEILIAMNSPETRLAAGQKIVVPNALPTSREYPGSAKPEWRAMLNQLNVDANQPKGEKIVVDKSDQVLRVLDGQGKLVAQFQATMGSSTDPLPLGTWKVLSISPMPDWKFNPKILKKVDDSKAAQIIPPGPNNPVGVVWIDLSKEHYGIHGTAEPHQIGRAQSNGCIRLTNWDVARLSLMIKPGVTAVFQA
ncbi:L,D-transpeptidase [uncultured Sphingomonas sp.]|uniref:L,D-transpeptidase family protein n=1 Tax=uncultured Sphingomonas sp. TaxID=158754 RepID=UPI0035CBA3C0